MWHGGALISGVAGTSPAMTNQFATYQLAPRYSPIFAEPALVDVSGAKPVR
jgi:hypothetical protein